MRCALVIYFVVTIFIVVYSLSELCVFNNYGGKRASCGRNDVKYIFDFIPPVSRNISFITMQGQPLKQLQCNAFRNLSSQTSISAILLRHCQISHIDAGALLNLPSLTDIELSYNDINRIDSKLFSNTKQIKYIYMGYNKIEVLPNGLFQNLTRLNTVSLQHNQIRHVESFSFKNTPSLRQIYLNNNQIEFMNMLFKDKFDKFTTLLLYGNPWKCNCKLGPLYEFLKKINQLNNQELVCKKPPTLHGKKWSDISTDEFVCRSENAISTQDSVMTSTELMTSTEQDQNLSEAVYNVPMSTQDSVMTSIEPMTTTEADDNIPVTVYNGTRDQQDDTGVPQPPSIQNWILHAILVLGCVAGVIIGVVFVVRCILAKSSRWRHVLLPVIVKRRSDRRTNTRNMGTDLSIRIIQRSAVAENNDSASNTDGVDEEQTPL